MNLEKKTYVKLVKDIKKDIKEKEKAGGYYQRIRLLSYGFVRETPYRKIENKINEDKFESKGQNSFRFSLALNVYSYISKMGMDLDKNYKDPVLKEIENWLKVPVLLKNNLYPRITVIKKYRVWPPKFEEQPLSKEETNLLLQHLSNNGK